MTVTQGHRVTRKLELCHKVAQTFVIVDDVREGLERCNVCMANMTAKVSCKYGRDGSVEHLLFFIYYHYDFPYLQIVI